MISGLVFTEISECWWKGTWSERGRKGNITGMSLECNQWIETTTICTKLINFSDFLAHNALATWHCNGVQLNFSANLAMHGSVVDINFQGYIYKFKGRQIIHDCFLIVIQFRGNIWDQLFLIFVNAKMLYYLASKPY